MKSKSYACGSWVEGESGGTEVRDAVNGKIICNVSSTGLDFAKMIEYGRTLGSVLVWAT